MTSEVYFLHVKSNKILQPFIVLRNARHVNFFEVLIASEKSAMTLCFQIKFCFSIF